MKFEIKNCNNLDSASIEIVEGRLNIKFAPNGAGKSTIAKAIQCCMSDNEYNLKELMPFKLKKTNPDGLVPQVAGANQISSVMCFNEDYVNNIVFRPDELVSNSFDVFVKNDNYKKLERDIEIIMQKIKSLFLKNEGLENLIAKLKELGGAFKLTKTGLNKSSIGMKCLAEGNKIQHIPVGLEQYSPFIQSDKNISWIDWQIKGNEFTELSDSCPFCTVDATSKREQIKKVSEEYNKTVIKNLIGIIDVIQKLGEYFSENARSTLEKITMLKYGLENEHIEFLVGIKMQIDNFVEKLEKLRTLTGFDFKSGEMIAEKLSSYKLELDFFSGLDSEKTRKAVLSINSSIDELIEEAENLKIKLNTLRSIMKKVIQKHQSDINDFLAYAGYKYKVEIAGDDAKSQLRLLHMDFDDHLSGGKQHLSFGERNAFAIVLFMYECLAKKPNLIILDDPISSFDKNKKYAILEMLFRRKAESCFKGKTVLMLTHDVEPIIDTIKAVASQFQNQTKAAFLKYKQGKISEVVIEKRDIQTFSEICKGALASNKDVLVKAVYLRRLLEITDEKGDGYQVLSNLLHKRPIAIDTREPKCENGKYPTMESSRFKAGCSSIDDSINGFKYQLLVNRASNIEEVKSLYLSCDNGYEKLQVFRLFDYDVENSVIQKFINETYHVENEYINQLSPEKFDMIPDYVIEECNKHIKMQKI
ncbi:AAA family ATPase [Myxococcota bacterium]|nr:AAA family ATPase [Myxococcota bacterium]MBU1382962.1 AAA family ATPase [Myxococcota bacterium]MBU1495488.1 AAA family ATPase [Myxococcota bacterium]